MSLRFRATFRLATAAMLLAVAPAALLADPLADIPISRSGGMVLIPVKVEGKPYTFVLDTGMTFSAVDASLRPASAKPVDRAEAATPAGKIMMEFYAAPKITVGGLPCRMAAIACMDVRTLTRGLGRNVKGFIGTDFLRDYVVQFDWSRGRMRLYAPCQAAPAWGRWSPMSLQAGVPVVTGRLDDDLAGSFIVDTGCNMDGCLSKPLYRQALDRRTRQQAIVVTVAGGTVKSRQARMNKLSVGNISRRGVRLGEGNFNLLGLGFLSRQMVTLDFPRGRMYLSDSSDTQRIRRRAALANRG